MVNNDITQITLPVPKIPSLDCSQPQCAYPSARTEYSFHPFVPSSFHQNVNVVKCISKESCLCANRHQWNSIFYISPSDEGSFRSSILDDALTMWSHSKMYASFWNWIPSQEESLEFWEISSIWSIQTPNIDKLLMLPRKYT